MAFKDISCIDDICKMDGRVVVKDNNTVIECDGIKITKDEFWEEIQAYEQWDIAITLTAYSHRE